MHSGWSTPVKWTIVCLSSLIVSRTGVSLPLMEYIRKHAKNLILSDCIWFGLIWSDFIRWETIRQLDSITSGNMPKIWFHLMVSDCISDLLSNYLIAWLWLEHWLPDGLIVWQCLKHWLFNFWLSDSIWHCLILTDESDNQSVSISVLVRHSQRIRESNNQCPSTSQGIRQLDNKCEMQSDTIRWNQIFGMFPDVLCLLVRKVCRCTAQCVQLLNQKGNYVIELSDQNLVARQSFTIRWP